MSFVSKVKNFDVKRVVVGAPVHVIDKNYVLNTQYINDGQKFPLRVQIPTTTVYNSLYETNGKFYIDLIMRAEGAFHKLHKDISQLCTSIANTNTRFKDCEFIHNIKRVHEDAYSVRIKIPRNGSNFQCKIWNSSNKETTPNSIASGDDVICILEIDCIFICDKTIMFNMLLNELKLTNR